MPSRKRSPRDESAAVTAYIDAAPEPARSRLRTLRAIIREEAPEAVERIAYGLATWHQGENLIHLGAFTHHVGVYPGAAAMVAFAEELAGYATSKGTIKLPHDERLPTELVRRITRWRVEQVSGAASAPKKTAKPKPAARSSTKAPNARAVRAKPARASERVVEWRGLRFLDGLPLEASELSAVARELGLALPALLEELFLHGNGGRVGGGYYLGETYEVEVGRILAIRPPKGSKRQALEEVHPNLVARLDMPRSFVPFAVDTGNANYFCVDLESGEVVYFVHDEPGDPAKRVAPSLDVFLAGLEPPPY